MEWNNSVQINDVYIKHEKKKNKKRIKIEENK